MSNSQEIRQLLDNPFSDPDIERFYPQEPRLRSLLLIHSLCVAKKALAIAEKLIGCSDLKPDLFFIAKASLLHDIGIQNCDAHSIFCFGQLPYICHGVEGARMLAEAGLLRYALICERHTGSGLTTDEIEEESLPLPARDMLPISLEEKIICYADKFFSKNPESLTREKSKAEARHSLEKFGESTLRRFDSLASVLEGCAE